MNEALRIKNLKVIFPTSYGVVQAVKGISLQIAKGECLALVGESGCGKSVTSLAIMKLLGESAEYRIDEHYIGGENVKDYSQKQMQKLRGTKISIIFQDALSALNPVMTVGKQLDEIFLHHTRISKSEAKEKSIELLDMVGIPNPQSNYKSYPHELSGGMRQRVLIAMAFACNPDIIIADEPTTALDVTIQAQILSLLSKLQKQNGTALLLITHDFSVVRHMADRVAVMYEGKIIEEKPTRELITNPSHEYTKELIFAVPTIDDEERMFDIEPRQEAVGENT